MSDNTQEDHRHQLAKVRLEHLYETARDRRDLTGQLSLQGLKGLFLLNGGAIIALFTLLGHGDLLMVQANSLTRAFTLFCSGVVMAMVALLVGFLAANFLGASESAAGEFIFFGGVGDADNSLAHEKLMCKHLALGNRIWFAAVICAVISLIAFVMGSEAALEGVKLKVAPVHQAESPGQAPPGKTSRATI